MFPAGTGRPSPEMPSRWSGRRTTARWCRHAAFGDLVGRPPAELIGRPAAELGLHVDASARGTVDDVEPWRVTSAQVELRTVSGTARLVEARST